MQKNDDEWKEELLKGFIENYEYPCVEAWDAFHVYVSSKLKNFYNFKHHSVLIYLLQAIKNGFWMWQMEHQVALTMLAF